MDTTAISIRVGFVGLGVMGQPMALNLARAGTELVVWNRTPSRAEPLREAGASVACDIDDLFERSKVVILMLADDRAMDQVLGRSGPDFQRRVRDHTLVHMGTTEPEYSRGLECDVVSAGGRYVEAPVSGSKVPAQNAQLVAMTAGDESSVRQVQPLLSCMCRATIECGAVPGGLVMKLAVNVFLITQVTGLAEALHFGERYGVDLSRLAEALNGGQMASDISRVKVAKYLEADFSPQASISDVLKNNRLIADAARSASVASPLIDTCLGLYTEAAALGAERDDMIAVLRAIQNRDYLTR